MTKNIPTAILFKEEGSRPRCFRMGSTSLSFRGISRRMSTASNMVSQAAGKRNVIWGVRTKEQIRWDRSKKAPKQNKNNSKNKLPNYTVTKLSVCMRLWCLDIALAPPGGHGQNKRKPTFWWRNKTKHHKINSVSQWFKEILPILHFPMSLNISDHFKGVDWTMYRFKLGGKHSRQQWA